MPTFSVQTTRDDARFGKVDIVAHYVPDVMWDPPGGCPPGGKPRYGCGFVEAREPGSGLILGGTHFDGDGDLIPYDGEELAPLAADGAALCIWYTAHGNPPADQTDDAIATTAAAVWRELFTELANNLLQEAGR